MKYKLGLNKYILETLLAFLLVTLIITVVSITSYVLFLNVGPYISLGILSVMFLITLLVDVKKVE